MSFWNILCGAALFEMICKWLSPKQNIANQYYQPHYRQTCLPKHELQRQIDELEKQLNDKDILSDRYDDIQDEIDMLQDEIDDIEDLEVMEDNLDDLNYNLNHIYLDRDDDW